MSNRLQKWFAVSEKSIEFPPCARNKKKNGRGHLLMPDIKRGALYARLLGTFALSRKQGKTELSDAI